METVRMFNPALFEPTTQKEDVTVILPNEKKDIVTNDVPVDLSEIKDKYLIDLYEEDKDLEYTMEINGINTFPKGDIQMIKAKAKQGKTHTIICLMTALLRGEFLTIKSKLANSKLCYFATEEQENSVKRIVRKVHIQCGYSPSKNNERFKAYSLRKQDSKQRAEYIEEQVMKEKPDVVFIDGVRDLLLDFNSIHESNEIVTLLLRLSERCNCSIVSVLHTNKGYSDSNMRGHLGTELLNKCSDVLEVSKNDNVFSVGETDCRNVGTGKWAFSIGENGLIQQVDLEQLKSKSDERVEKMKDMFSKILADGRILSFTDLKREYMILANVKEDAGNKHITEACKKHILEKTSDKKYKLYEVTV